VRTVRGVGVGVGAGVCVGAGVGVGVGDGVRIGWAAVCVDAGPVEVLATSKY
jgi:hypothetical protein